MRRTSAIILGTLLILLSLGFSGYSQTVRGYIEKKTVKRGGSARGKVILSIPPELHVNSHRPSDEFFIPTTLRFNHSTFKISRISYPKATLRNFAFSEKPVSVYEGEVVIIFSFFVPADFRGNRIKIAAQLQFQPCSREVCFPPKKVKVMLSAKIK